MTEYTLSDEAIAQIAKLIQIAILTGTDVVDNLRMMRLCESQAGLGSLVLTEEYRASSDGNVEKMMKRAVDLQSDQEETLSQL